MGWLKQSRVLERLLGCLHGEVFVYVADVGWAAHLRYEWRLYLPLYEVFPVQALKESMRSDLLKGESVFWVPLQKTPE